jgi:glycosyltransferase involved in cell wall biosynthesis
MSEDILQWAVDRAQRARNGSDRVFYLGYQRPSIADSANKPELARVLESTNGRFTVCFVGTFARYHNPQILVDAARVLPQAEFVLAGDGQHRPEVLRRAEGVQNVHLPGWLDQSDIALLLTRSSVGVCTASGEVERTFLPNKVFAYLAAGLPIVSGFKGELGRLLESEQVGFTYSDLPSLVKIVERLHYDAQLRTQMSNTARQLFAARFQADQVYQAYATHLETIAADFRSTPAR